VRVLVADTPPTRAEHMGLHLNEMVIDRERVFIGSMNLDPRSWEINSEMGIVVESPGLAPELAKIIERDMAPENAWRVTRGPAGEIIWTVGGESTSEQPARNFWQRMQYVFFMAFPCGSM